MGREGFWGLIETDFGSKGRAKTAAERLGPEITKETKWRLQAWWFRVKETAKALCPVDTGTLRMTIRIEPKESSIGMGAPTFMVVYAPQNELINSMIVAGGMGINPKTGRICDYAAAVHDGTMRMMARPFLQDAINIHINELNKILNDGIDKSLNTVWVGQ